MQSLKAVSKGHLLFLFLLTGSWSPLILIFSPAFHSVIAQQTKNWERPIAYLENRLKSTLRVCCRLSCQHFLRNYSISWIINSLPKSRNLFTNHFSWPIFSIKTTRQYEHKLSAITDLRRIWRITFGVALSLTYSDPTQHIPPVAILFFVTGLDPISLFITTSRDSAGLLWVIKPLPLVLWHGTLVSFNLVLIPPNWDFTETWCPQYAQIHPP